MSTAPVKKQASSAARRTGFETTLTEQQAAALAEVKARMAKTELQPDLDQNPDGDRFTLRFLRATMSHKSSDRVFNVDKAVDRLTRTLRWRRKYKADHWRRVLETGGPMPEGYDRYMMDVRPGLELVDPATGRPVRFERFGLLSQYLNTHHFTEDEWITFFVIDLEKNMNKMRAESAARGVEVSTMVSIIDEAGAGLGVLSRMGLFKVMNQAASEYYPEFISNVFILRAPWVFSASFNTIKGFLDPDMASKIVVTNGLGTEALGGVLAQELIPAELGGESKAEMPVPIDARHVFKSAP